MKRHFSSAIVLIGTLAFHCQAYEPLSYDYVYGDLASGTKDEALGNNSDILDLKVGGYYKLDETWLLTGEYSARFVHLDNTTAQHYVLLPGIGAHFKLSPKMDMLVDGKVGAIRYVLTDDDTDDNLSTSTKFMYGAGVRFRYALTDNWQFGAGLHLHCSDVVDENIMEARVDYRFNERFGLGGFYTHSEYDHHTSNSGGISARVYY